MIPTISPVPTSNVDVVDRPDASEGDRQPVHGENRHVIDRPDVVGPRRTGIRFVVGQFVAAGEEDRAQQVGPVEQLGRRATEADLAALHEIRPVGDRERDVHALLHQHHGHAIARHPLHNRQQLADDHRCQPERQLVDQQNLRPHDEAHGEGQHLLLAAGQVCRRGVESFAEDRECLEGLGDRCLDAGRVAPVGPSGQFEVLLHGQRTEHALAAGHLHDAERGDLVRWGVRDVPPVEHDRAAVGLDHTADRLQQRRLPGAVGAEQGDDLALLEFEVDVAQHGSLAVAGLDTARRAAGSCCRAGGRTARRNGPRRTARPA